MPFDPTKLDPVTFVYGGLTLAMLLLIWVYYKTVTNHGHDWMRAIERNTEAWNAHSKIMQKLIDVIAGRHKENNG